MLTAKEIKTAQAELTQFLKPCKEWNDKFDFSFHVEDDCIKIAPIKLYDSPRDYGEIKPGYIWIPLKWGSQDDSDTENSFIFIPTRSKGVIKYKCYLPPYCDQDGDASLFDVVWYPSLDSVKPLIHACMKDSLREITGFLKVLNQAAVQAGLDFRHSILDASMADAFENWNAK